MRRLRPSSIGTVALLLHALAGADDAPPERTQLRLREHDAPPEGNRLCTQTYGPGPSPLPCRPARDHWKSAFRHTFAITAWYPPGLHYVNGTGDLSLVTEYANGGFNMLFGGDGNIGCTGDDPDASGPKGSAEQAFDCLARAAKDLQKLDLKLAFHPTDVTASGGPTVLGGRAGMGGVTDSGQGSWSITTPEVAWVVGELEKRNLTSVIAQIFFHDDEIGDSAAIANSVRWLRENAPHITPQANTFSDAAPESLYQDGQFLFAPEQCKSDTLTICARSLAVLTRALLQMRSTAAARTRRR